MFCLYGSKYSPRRLNIPSLWKASAAPAAGPAASIGCDKLMSVMKNRKLVLYSVIGLVVIFVALFSIPVYQRSVNIACGLKKGTIRKNIILGDSKDSIEQEIQTATKLNEALDCAKQSGNTTYKLYLL